MTDTSETQGRKPAKTAAGWKKAKVHEDVTLPSGFTVDIQLPNIGQLLKSGDIPNPLIESAIEFQGAARESNKITKEMLEDSFEWVCWIIPRTVVSPKIEADDVADLPPEDLDMLAAFVARATDLDAVGHHLGGLDTNADFRRFRDLNTIDEIYEGLRGSG